MYMHQVQFKLDLIAIILFEDKIMDLDLSIYKSLDHPFEHKIIKLGLDFVFMDPMDNN